MFTRLRLRFCALISVIVFFIRSKQPWSMTMAVESRIYSITCKLKTNELFSIRYWQTDSQQLSIRMFLFKFSFVLLTACTIGAQQEC